MSSLTSVCERSLITCGMKTWELKSYTVMCNPVVKISHKFQGLFWLLVLKKIEGPQFFFFLFFSFFFFFKGQIWFFYYLLYIRASGIEISQHFQGLFGPLILTFWGKLAWGPALFWPLVKSVQKRNTMHIKKKLYNSSIFYLQTWNSSFTLQSITNPYNCCIAFCINWPLD